MGRPELQTVLVNTAGGITGGDQFRISGHAATDTELTLTTQAAERAYRAVKGETGRVRTSLSVAQGARLQWLPQETILFDGCALERSVAVDLAEDARLLFVEPLVFGRDAMGERLTNARLWDRVQIRRAGEPLFYDAMRLDGDVSVRLALPHVGNGAGALATVILVAPDAEAQLGPVREGLPDTAGVSLIRTDLLVARILAEDSHLLRRSLLPILTRLRGRPLPRTWMI